MALSDDDLDRHPEFAIAKWAVAKSFAEWSANPPPVAPLPIATGAPGLVVEGPANGYADTMKFLYEAAFRS